MFFLSLYPCLCEMLYEGGLETPRVIEALFVHNICIRNRGGMRNIIFLIGCTKI